MPDDQVEESGPWSLTGYNLPLAYGVAPDRHLRAHCGACGRRVVFDPTPWVKQRLSGLPLQHFESRLRCVCGARRATLEIWPGPRPDAPRDWSIYPFR